VGLFYRVFGRGDSLPPATALGTGPEVTLSADDSGWFRAEIALSLGGTLCIERYTPEDDGFRAELNTWAAYLETCDYSPHHVALMEHVIQSRQLFILRKPIDCPNEAAADRFCLDLSRQFATQSDGIYHIDDVGFFAADGTLLVPEY
jgi:hypothetical protein